MNKAFQRRWFVLKGNLLFYFEKHGGDLLGFIILEGCVIELAEAEMEKYCFNINFLGNRSYVLSAESQDSLESWMRALTCSGFDYMRLMVSELQRQLDEIDKVSSSSSEPDRSSDVPPIPPRRQNPFNKFNGNFFSALDLENPVKIRSSPGNGNANVQQVAADNSVVLRPAPPPPIDRSNLLLPDSVRDTARFDVIRDDNEFLMFEPENDDFTFEKIHEEFGRPILLAMKERKALKERAEMPLIQL